MNLLLLTLYISIKKDFHCIELKHLNEQPNTYTIMEGLNHLYEEDEQKSGSKNNMAILFVL